MTTTRQCSIEGCTKIANTYGYCTTHLGRFRRTGDPNGKPPERIEILRTRWRVVPSGCWEWQGPLQSGYGKIYYKRNGKRSGSSAHRYIYQILVAPIPDHLELDHLCRNPSCVNPAHMEPVTHAENMRRIPPKTHCVRGHAYDRANTYVTKRGSPQCRTCHREQVARSKEEHRG